MDLLIVALLIVGIGLNDVLCFFIGAKLGQQVSNKEPVKLPSINPVEIYKEHQEKKEFEEEISALEKSLENINSYGSDKPQLKI